MLVHYFIGLKQLSEFAIKRHVPQRKTNGYCLPLSMIYPICSFRILTSLLLKHHSVVHTGTSTSSDSASHCISKEMKVSSLLSTPSHAEQQEFFRQLSQEQNKGPVILSVVESYNNDVVISSNYLPLQCLFRP